MFMLISWVIKLKLVYIKCNVANPYKVLLAVVHASPEL